MSPIQSERQKPSQRKFYIFGVVFLALFLFGILFTPMRQFAYKSRAVVALDNTKNKKLDSQQFQSELASLTTKILSDDQLKALLKRIPARNYKSSLLINGDVEAIRSAFHLGVKTFEDNDQHLISVSINGSGTSDEQLLVNLLASKIMGKLQDDQMEGLSFRNIVELQRRIDHNIARLQGIENFRTLLLSTHFRRVQGARDNNFATVEPRNVQASTASMVQSNPVNPAWAAFRSRRDELIKGQIKLQPQSLQSIKAEDALVMIEEELAWIDRHLRVEKEYLPKTNSITSGKSNQENADNSIAQNNPGDGGPVVKVNKYFKRASFGNNGIVDEVDVFLDDDYLVATNGVLAELDIRTDEINQNQAALTATTRSALKSIKVPKSTVDVRMVQTANESIQVRNSVEPHQVFWIFLVGAMIAGVIGWRADFRVDPTAFNSSEDVSRKLGIPVLGTLGKSTSEPVLESKIIKYAVSGCEIAIVLFAVMMIYVALSDTTIGTQILRDPLNGFVNAIWSIRSQ